METAILETKDWKASEFIIPDSGDWNIELIEYALSFIAEEISKINREN